MSDSEEDHRRTKYQRERPRNTKNPSRSRSPRSCRDSPKRRSSRSSSRGTFDDIELPSEEKNSPPNQPKAKLRRSSSREYYSCSQCRKTFDTVRDISKHEIRKHECKILCYHCDKKSVSVGHLPGHTEYRHGPRPVMCGYCKEPFGKSAECMSASDWEVFKDHIEKEAIGRQMQRYEPQPDNPERTQGIALRGVGMCPHGPPVKCRNFPMCPGSKCIYSHNMCRYENNCNKATCPFDHDNRPRICMSCVNDMKRKKNPRSY